MTEEFVAFAGGFLKAASSAGRSLDQAIDRLDGFVRSKKEAVTEKAAIDPTTPVKNLTSAAKDVVGTGAALGAAILLGTGGLSYFGGRLLPHLTDISEDELEEERLRDLSREYQRQTTLANQNAQAGHYRRARRLAVRGRAL